MKIHIFRIKRVDGLSARLYTNLDEKYPVYAFTSEKKLAMQFMEERDQSNFIYIKVDKDDDDAESWCAYHNVHQLGRYNLETFINKNLDSQDVRYVQVLATGGEIDYLMESIDTFNVIHRFCDYISPDVFTDKIYNVLKYFGYVDMARFHESMTVTECADGNIICEPNSDEDDLDFLGSIPIRFDQLGSWILLSTDMLTDAFYKNIKYTVDPVSEYDVEPKHKKKH